MGLFLNIVLILLPFIVGVFLLIYFKMKAHQVGIIIYAIMFVLAIIIFKTNWKVGILASLAGMVKSFPISMMVLTSIFMMTYQEKTGSLQKIVVNFKKIGGGNQAFQIMFINLALGTFLVSIGATPVTMLPPVLLAMGYSAFAAVSLPAIGYDPLCTFALLAVPAVFFAEFMGIPLQEAGFAFSLYMPIITLGIAFGMLWLAGGKKLLFNKESLVFAITAGLVAGGTAIVTNYFGIVTLTGVISGLATALALLLVAKIKKIKIFDPSVLSEEEKLVDQSMPLWKAFFPWILLIIFAIVTNLIPAIHQFLTEDLALPVTIGEVVVKTEVFSHAYFWVLISTLLSIPILRKYKKGSLKESTQIWIKRSLRPVFTAAIFFGIAFLFINSGTILINGAWEKVNSNNMVSILSEGTAQTFGRFYPLVVPFVGLFAGFISGSETSAIAMFTNFHAQTAVSLGMNPIAVGTANGVGGGLASVISPAKIQNAAATIDEVGIEGEIIKKTAPITFLMCISVALICFGWASSFSWWKWLIMASIYIVFLGIGVFILNKRDNLPHIGKKE
ncbi:L-lactate permease [Candidatus Lokiarchaeum ossiferum]|uniref:L-lactate permease n=1 Tax=Candidatus Lokiarchaeum ossiferum TaxID=2951803 RepID=UPI00352D7C99